MSGFAKQFMSFIINELKLNGVRHKTSLNTILNIFKSNKILLKLVFSYLLIVLLFQNVLAQDQSISLIEIHSITVKGDKITHKPIIYRELEFSVGDILTEDNLDKKILKSRQNLLNRSLFNFVTVTKTIIESKCDIVITVIERWYIWPIPLIEYSDRNINVWWESKDFSRLNYGMDLRIENFRGRMETLNIIAKGGYDQTLAFKWQLPYLNKNQKLGMGIDAGFQQNHEIAYKSDKNKYLYYKSNSYVKQFAFARISASLRPEFNFQHQISIAVNNLKINDSVLVYNPNYTYGGTNYNYFSINYNYKRDFRNFKQYPINGYYYDLTLEKTGLGILSKEVNQFTIDFNIDHYFNIWKRWYFAYGFSGRYTFTGDFQPYFLTSGIGLSGLDIRGYELYVINGQNIGIIKSNLKFNIIPKTNFNIKWIKSEKFNKVFYALFANLFFDFGYSQDKFYSAGNPLSNQLLWGTGLGLDFVTYYDIVLRLEYAINKQSKTGFYISLVAPI